MSLFSILIIITWIGIVSVVVAYLIFRRILTPYRLRVDGPEFTELLTILNAVIGTEIELWEKDVFSSKNYLTNSNFDNYYHEITERVLQSLPEDYFLSMSRYLKPEAVVSMIGRHTKEYLVSKVNGTV